MTAVPPDPHLLRAFWTAFRDATGTIDDEPADVFAFGDSSAMADALADLVLDGTKRATAAAVVDYDQLGWSPSVGDLSVVHRGDGTPVAVVRTTEIRRGPLSSVDEAFAWDEGEGERTRDWWVSGHLAYFRRNLAHTGMTVDETLPLIFERFDVVWSPHTPPGTSQTPAGPV